MSPEFVAAAPGRQVRWLRVVPGAALLLVCSEVLASRWAVLTTGDPAYAQLILVSLLLAGWLLVSGIRSRTPARPGRVRLVLRVLAGAAGVGLAAMLLWLTPFAATPAALGAMRSTAAVTVTDSRSAIVFEPSEPAKAGLVLYPGARVDPRAYAVLASGVAERGYRVVVVKCPLNVALLCPDAASIHLTDDIPWAVGGHSLGGVTAAEYAKRHHSVDGLVLWAAFPFSDLSSRTGLTTASISGSRDGLSTPAAITAHRHLLPKGTVYTRIAGAVHSFFGDYGPQPGDNVPTVTRTAAQEQIIRSTAQALNRMVRATRRAVATSKSSTS